MWGWVATAMLFFSLSASAWGLDLDRKIQSENKDVAQVLSTLGRRPNSQTSRFTKKKVYVQLLRAHKHRRHV